MVVNNPGLPTTKIDHPHVSTVPFFDSNIMCFATLPEHLCSISV